MEFVGILRVLSRHRVLVVLSLIPAVAIALVLGHTRHTVGAGTASALVDTHRSQTVDLGTQIGAGVPAGSDIETLVARATLLSSVMTSSPIKDQIARSAGIRPRRLIGFSSTTAGSIAVQPVTPSSAATTISATVPQLDTGQIPIIVVNTRAPTAALAQRIADASFTQLTASLGTVAGNDRVPKADRLVIRRLGAATSATLHKGMSMPSEIAVALGVFLALCLLILGVHALVDGWHRASALERDPGDGLPVTAEGNRPDPHQSSLFDHKDPPRDASAHAPIYEPTQLAHVDEILAAPTKRRRKLPTVRS